MANSLPLEGGCNTIIRADSAQIIIVDDDIFGVVLSNLVKDFH